MKKVVICARMGGNSMIHNLTQKNIFNTQQQFIELNSMLCVNNFDKSCIKSGKFYLLSQKLLSSIKNATSYKRFIGYYRYFDNSKKARNLNTHTQTDTLVSMFTCFYKDAKRNIVM